MRFLCVQCDETFDADDERPRCPKCMRVHGIRPLAAAPERGSPRVRLIAASGVLVAALAALAVGVALWPGPETGHDDGGAGDVVAELDKQGVAAGELSDLLAADEAVTAFARQVAGDGDAVARAKAVVAALRARADVQAFVPWSMVDPRQGAPMTAAAVLSALHKDGARHKLYPLEVSALAVAALRAVDVPAQVAEVVSVAGDRAPLDPSGCIGYFGVLIPQAGGDGRAFDPYAGRALSADKSEVTPVSDRQAVAAALGLRALHGIVWEAKPAAALADAEAALSLWPNAASLRSVRAVALAASGGVQQGEEALEAAAQLRADAPRLNNLATYRLQRGDVKAATRHVTRALELAPDYAAARVVLAGVHLAQRETDLAHGELTRAERLDPELPTLPLAWAQYYAAKGDFDEAVRRAKRGAELRPNQPHLQLSLGRLYRAAGRYDDMRRAARRALELTPSAGQQEMRKMIGALLGPTALEAPEEDPAPGEGAMAASDDEEQGSAPGVDPRPSDVPSQALPAGDELDVSRGSRLLSGERAGQGLQLGKSPRKLGLGEGELDLDVKLAP